MIRSCAVRCEGLVCEKHLLITSGKDYAADFKPKPTFPWTISWGTGNKV